MVTGLTGYENVIHLASEVRMGARKATLRERRHYEEGEF